MLQHSKKNPSSGSCNTSSHDSGSNWAVIAYLSKKWNSGKNCILDLLDVAKMPHKNSKYLPTNINTYLSKYLHTYLNTDFTLVYQKL